MKHAAALTTCVLVLVPTIHSLHAESLTCRPHAIGAATGATEPSTPGVQSIDSLQLNPTQLLPSTPELLVRSFGLQMKVVDRPDFFSDTFELPASERFPEGRTVRRSQRDLQYNLFSATASFDFSRMLLSQKEIGEAFALADRSSDPVAELGREPEEFFLREGAKHTLGRIFAGFSVAYTRGERPQRDATGPIDLRAIAEDEFADNWSITFDPKKIPSLASRKASALGLLDDYQKKFPQVLDLSDYECSAGTGGTQPESCLREVAGSGRNHILWRTLLPTIKYETIDQFDYFRFGEIFLYDQRVDDIETFTVTWDFGSVIGAIDELRALAKAAKVLSDIHKRNRALSMPLQVEVPAPLRAGGSVTAAIGDLIYLRFAVEDNALGETWCAVRGPQDPCPKVSDVLPDDEGLHFQKDGLLHGYRINGKSQTFYLRVEDSNKRRQALECTLR